MTDFTFIVLNYKTYEMTYRCLSCLLKLNGSFNIIVVDNCGFSKKFEELKSSFRSIKISFCSTGKNLGYSAGNNFGFDYAINENILGKHTIILNNDVLINDLDFLYKLLHAIKRNPGFGCISPKIIHKATGIIQGPYRKESVMKYVFEGLFPPIIYFRKALEQYLRRKIRFDKKVYRTMGCCLILNSKIFKEIGRFDESVFLGSEEEILAEKLILKNRPYIYCPDFSVLHDHGQSTKLISSNLVNEHFRQSKLYYFKKYRNAKKLKLSVLSVFLIIRDMLIKVFK